MKCTMRNELDNGREVGQGRGVDHKQDSRDPQAGGCSHARYNARVPYKTRRRPRGVAMPGASTAVQCSTQLAFNIHVIIAFGSSRQLRYVLGVSPLPAHSIP